MLDQLSDTMPDQIQQLYLTPPHNNLIDLKHFIGEGYLPIHKTFRSMFYKMNLNVTLLMRVLLISN